jgi:hypothetical protein
MKQARPYSYKFHYLNGFVMIVWSHNILNIRKPGQENHQFWLRSLPPYFALAHSTNHDGKQRWSNQFISRIPTAECRRHKMDCSNLWFLWTYYFKISQGEQRNKKTPTQSFSAAKCKLHKLIRLSKTLVPFDKLQQPKYSIVFIRLYISIADL